MSLQPLGLALLVVGLPLLCSAAVPELAHRPLVASVISPTPKGPGVYALTAERRAALETIRFAEGTWNGGGTAGYHMVYGGGSVRSLERHPDTVVVKRYASAAAGAYQFLPSTWQAAQGALGLSGFGPASQDQAALHLMNHRGALADLDRGVLSDQAIDRLAQEWASFPASSGTSLYGQPSKTVSQLRAFHRSALLRQRLSGAVARA